MLTRIQARNYRCLKHVDQQLSHFDILVGGNGVGKSTFLDVVQLVGDILKHPRDGVHAALSSRSRHFDSLLFSPGSNDFEVGIEATLTNLKALEIAGIVGPAQIHFRIKIGRSESEKHEIGVLEEQLLLSYASPPETDSNLAQSRFVAISREISIPIIKRLGSAETTVYQRERPANGSELGWSQFRISPHTSAFANLPEDTEHFPVATWFRQCLTDNVMLIGPDSESFRKPMSDINGGQNRASLNLPKAVSEFNSTNPRGFEQWIRHLQVALPDFQNITVAERPEYPDRYVVAHYSGSRAIPSWLLSNGTLRLFALTLAAYALDDGHVFLIEEPENCIHPLAIEVVMQSLSSMYESQVFVTTHSPAILSLAEPENILCFSKSVEEGTSIVRGNDHPRLSEWKKSIDLGTLLASGILG